MNMKGRKAVQCAYPAVIDPGAEYVCLGLSLTSLKSEIDAFLRGMLFFDFTRGYRGALVEDPFHTDEQDDPPHYK